MKQIKLLNKAYRQDFNFMFALMSQENHILKMKV